MALGELADMKNSIEELRHRLDGLYDFIDQAESSIQEMERVASQAQHTVEKVAAFNHEIVALQNSLASLIQPVENAVAVMQRELTHLERISAEGLAQQPDVTVRAVSSLLQLSLSIAVQFFSVEQLKAFCTRQNGFEVDRLRRRWMDWFGELTEYLAQTLHLAQTLAEQDGVGTLAADYTQAVENLARQCIQWQVFLSSKTSAARPAALEAAPAKDAGIAQTEVPKKRKRATRRTGD